MECDKQLAKSGKMSHGYLICARSPTFVLLSTHRRSTSSRCSAGSSWAGGVKGSTAASHRGVLERLAAQTRFDSITASSAIEDVFVDDDRAIKILRDPDGAGAYPGLALSWSSRGIATPPTT